MICKQQKSGFRNQESDRKMQVGWGVDWRKEIKKINAGREEKRKNLLNSKKQRKMEIFNFIEEGV